MKYNVEPVKMSRKTVESANACGRSRRAVLWVCANRKYGLTAIVIVLISIGTVILGLSEHLLVFSIIYIGAY